MTDPENTGIQGDLAYVRAMTERAVSAPLLGGRFLVLWGGLLTVAYSAHFLVVSGIAGLPLNAIALIWVAFGVVGALAMMVLSRGVRRKPGQSAIGNVVEREVWRGAGLGIFLFALGVGSAVYLRGAPTILFDLIASVALALYGAAFLATSAAARKAWIRIPAWTALIGAAAVPVFAGTAELYAFLVAAVVAVGVLPGVKLLWDEPAALEDES